MEADELDELRSYIAHELENYFFSVNEVEPREVEVQQEQDILVGLVDYEFEQQHRMPKISKKPDLSSFTQSELYTEIKRDCGLPANNKIPSDIWSLENLIRYRENGVIGHPYGTLSSGHKRRIGNLYIPNEKAERLMSLESKIFISKFNRDGSHLITGSQDSVIRIFDASKGTYHRVNRIQAQDVNWCILDMDFSPCGREFVYSTWSDYFISCPISGSERDFTWANIRSQENRACVFSVRYSPCGKYFLGGCNNSTINLFDRESQVPKRIYIDDDGRNDVNAVSYLDDSPFVFVSGCHYGQIRIWDSRCLGGESSGSSRQSRHSHNRETHKPVGYLLGHMDGITYLDSKCDGRYLLSNSKDQSIKIWDIRVPLPKEKEDLTRKRVHLKWDYRWDSVPNEFYNLSDKNDGDTSVMTYRGHRVTKSLIRAKFSPLETTGQRFIYTGCGTGRVIVYDVLTGKIREAIGGHRDVVRDVDWHPIRHEIVSSSWDSHVNLNKFKRTAEKVASASGGRKRHDDDCVRRSRRLALRTNATVDTADDMRNM